MEHLSFDRLAEVVALDRYSVIAPMVTRTLSPLEYGQELTRAAGAVHHFKSNDRHVKFSGRTVQRWHRWFVQGREREGTLILGLDALKPARRADCGVARDLADEVVELAERLRREEPTRTTATLISLIQADYESRELPVPEIVEATLARRLRKKYASRRALKREGRAFRRYERPHRSSVWQADFMQAFRIADPTEPGKMRMTHLHAFIDDHTRFIVHAEFYFKQDAPCLEDCFRKAIIAGGVPESTYWDNAKVYQAHQLQLVAARLGTQVIFSTPYAPEGKGKIERWFHTVQTSFLPEAKRAGITTLEALNHFFWGWLESQYQTREHASLGAGTTPRARWEAEAHRMRPIDPASLVDLFLWEETRRVNKTGCFRLKARDYAVEEHLVGRTVQVRYDPFDLSRVRVYVAGHFIQTTEPFELSSHTGRAATPDKPQVPAPLASAEKYRRRLSAGYQREVEATLARAKHGGRSHDCLTRAELAASLSEALQGRLFSLQEGSQIADFFTRNAPLRTDATRNALNGAVEEKGTQRHLRFYLDAVREARLEGGGR